MTVSAASGVLANDSDVNGDALTATVVDSPENGTLSLNPDGSFTFTPDADFNGTDTFTYQASDGTDSSEPTSVTITVQESALLSARLEITSLDGTPISTIAEGEAFILNVYAADLRDVPQGVFAMYLDLLYDSSLVSLEGEPIFSGDLLNGQSGHTSVPGLIDELGAFSDISPTGVSESLLASIQFMADTPGTASFSSNGADSLPAHDSAVYGLNDPIDVDRILYGSATLEVIARAAGEGEAEALAAHAAHVDEVLANADEWLTS